MREPLKDDEFLQHKTTIYGHAQKRVIQGDINSSSAKKLLIVIGHHGCGNCAHMDNQYLKLDVTYEDFPIPIQDCKTGICRALCVAYLVRAIEKNGYKPYKKGTC